MNSQKIRRALREIAQREGVSVEEVRRQIELAMTYAKKNPDPQIRAFWNSVPHKGDRPTPEEVIAHIAAIAAEKKGL